MKSAFAQVVAAAALTAAAFSAQAITFNLSGYANGSVHASGGAPGFDTNAGAFIGTHGAMTGFAENNSFITYCVQLTEFFSFNNMGAYTLVESGASYFDSQFPSLPSNGSEIVARLGRLFTHLGGVSMPSSPENSAAIQLAVWESIYEGGSTLDVSNGVFSATSTAVSAANSLLASAASATSLYSVSVLQNIGAQDFLLISTTSGSTGGNVSEPASLGLVALALGGLALSRRRRA